MPFWYIAKESSSEISSPSNAFKIASSSCMHSSRVGSFSCVSVFFLPAKVSLPVCLFYFLHLYRNLSIGYVQIQQPAFLHL